MMASVPSFFQRSGRAFLAVALSLLTASQLQAAELKLEVKLIWGTNSETVSDPKIKPVDEATASKFRNVFKWKKYYEVNRQVAIIPSRATKPIPISKKCVVEITELEGPKVAVKLIGEGKPVNKTTKQLSKGEYFILSGDCKDGNAWFVLITELDEK